MEYWMTGCTSQNALFKMHKQKQTLLFCVGRCIFLNPDFTLRVPTHTSIHTHIHCDFFILISSLQRKQWSHEQCKLGKMFRKVAFPTGTSRLQLWVSALCVCVCVCMCITLLASHLCICACMITKCSAYAWERAQTWFWMHVCSSGLPWAAEYVLCDFRQERMRKKKYKARGWWKLRAQLCQTSPISSYKGLSSC